MLLRQLMMESCCLALTMRMFTIDSGMLHSTMILLGSCRGGGSQNLCCLCGSCDGVGVDEVSSAGSVGPFCCFSALSSSLLILFFSTMNSSRDCILFMLACCWIRSSLVTSISFRWTFTAIRAGVSTREQLQSMV